MSMMKRLLNELERAGIRIDDADFASVYDETMKSITDFSKDPSITIQQFVETALQCRKRLKEA